MVLAIPATRHHISNETQWPGLLFRYHPQQQPCPRSNNMEIDACVILLLVYPAVGQALPFSAASSPDFLGKVCFVRKTGNSLFTKGSRLRGPLDKQITPSHASTPFIPPIPLLFIRCCRIRWPFETDCETMYPVSDKFVDYAGDPHLVDSGDGACSAPFVLHRLIADYPFTMTERHRQCHMLQRGHVSWHSIHHCERDKRIVSLCEKDWIYFDEYCYYKPRGNSLAYVDQTEAETVCNWYDGTQDWVPNKYQRDSFHDNGGWLYWYISWRPSPGATYRVRLADHSCVCYRSYGGKPQSFPCSPCRRN